MVGPIAYDLIVSKEAARLKAYDCDCCGEFDGIVVPNLATGNVMIKVLQHSAGADHDSDAGHHARRVLPHASPDDPARQRAPLPRYP